jgi:predicted RNA binding protein YcfA (HicA-like mRNA interferase family)
MKYRDVARKLKLLGCEAVPRRGKGSHRVWHNPANGRITTLPDWGGKDLKIGTIRGVVKQLGLEWGQFERQ